MITDNDAVTLQQYHRRSARVEAMRLDDFGDLKAAWGWAKGKGMHVAFNSWDGINLVGPHGVAITARFGQWLTFTPATGAFEVYDDDEFRTAHNAVTGADSE